MRLGYYRGYYFSSLRRRYVRHGEPFVCQDEGKVSPIRVADTCIIQHMYLSKLGGKSGDLGEDLPFLVSVYNWNINHFATPMPRDLGNSRLNPRTSTLFHKDIYIIRYSYVIHYPNTLTCVGRYQPKQKPRLLRSPENALDPPTARYMNPLITNNNGNCVTEEIAAHRPTPPTPYPNRRTCNIQCLTGPCILLQPVPANLTMPKTPMQSGLATIPG